MAACNVDKVVDSPFSEVDEVKDEIFRKIISFPVPNPSDRPVEDQQNQPESNYQKIAGFLSQAIPRVSDFGYFRAEEDPSAAKGGDRVADVEVLDIPGHNHPEKRKPGNQRRYPTLPEDVEILETPGVEYDEEATMAAIRTIMIEQKREYSRRILPELIPDDMPGAEDGDGMECGAESDMRSLLAGLVRSFRSRKVRGLLRWCLLCAAMSFLNRDYFITFAWVSLCSFTVLFLLYEMARMLERILNAITSFFAQLCQTLHQVLLPGWFLALLTGAPRPGEARAPKEAT